MYVKNISKVKIAKTIVLYFDIEIFMMFFNSIDFVMKLKWERV